MAKEQAAAVLVIGQQHLSLRGDDVPNVVSTLI